MSYKPGLPNKGYSVFAWFWRLITAHPHAIITQPDGSPQLVRWWLIPRNRFFNIYLHHTLKSDEDRALHDHPWASMSILLWGRLEETYSRTPYKSIYRARRLPWLWPVFRKATDAHRLRVPDPSKTPWTLFITGPKVRKWGFWFPMREKDGRLSGWNEWLPWEKYTYNR